MPSRATMNQPAGASAECLCISSVQGVGCGASARRNFGALEIGWHCLVFELVFVPQPGGRASLVENGIEYSELVEEVVG